MVTDAQYQLLESRVAELERKLQLLSLKYSELYMKKDASTIDSSSNMTNVRRRDITRYRFDDQILCKRQLVLECVKWCVSNMDIKTSEDLFRVFPDYVQGPLGIVKRIEDAEKYSGAQQRFFFGDSEVIIVSDGVFAVCSQWDKNNIGRFLNLADDLGLKIEIIRRKY